MYKKAAACFTNALGISKRRLRKRKKWSIRETRAEKSVKETMLQVFTTCSCILRQRMFSTEQLKAIIRKRGTVLPVLQLATYTADGRYKIIADTNYTALLKKQPLWYLRERLLPFPESLQTNFHTPRQPRQCSKSTIKDYLLFPIG